VSLRPQGELLAEHMEVPRLSTGEMLRKARAERTELGREAQRFMDAGELVPDAVVLGLVAQALNGSGPAAGFVLDGFPRTIPQAEGLSDLLAERRAPIDAVVLLKVPEEELVRRLTGRSAAESRTDDDPETVSRRIEVYYAETEPVVHWYGENGVQIIEEKGIGSIEQVQASLRERLSL
jgi:adenylate kinase